MFPDAPLTQAEYLMTLLGFNYQWLLFNYMSNSTNALHYVVMTFALIGGLVILIMPRFQKLTTIVPYLFLVFIVIIAPYNSDLFFSPGTSNSLNPIGNPGIIDGNDVLYTTYSRCNYETSNSPCVGAAPSDRTVAKATGRKEVLDKIQDGNITDIRGFVPQMAVIHFVSKIGRNIATALNEEPASTDVGYVPIPMSMVNSIDLADEDRLSSTSIELLFEKSMFAKACPGFVELSLTSTNRLEPDGSFTSAVSNFFLSKTKFNRIGYTYFDLNTVNDLNNLYYTMLEKNPGLKALPPKAEALIPFSTFAYTKSDLENIPVNGSSLSESVAMQKLNKFINGGFIDITTIPLANIYSETVGGGTGSAVGNDGSIIANIYSPLKSDAGNASASDPVIREYYGNNVENDIKLEFKLLSNWKNANTYIVKNKKYFPTALYKEPISLFGTPLLEDEDVIAKAGKMTEDWTVAEFNKYKTKKQYVDNVKALAGTPAMNLPVAIRLASMSIKGSTPSYSYTSGQYKTTESVRVTNCAEFHRVLNMRYLNYAASQRNITKGLTKDADNPVGNIITADGRAYPFNPNGKDAEYNRILSNAVRDYIATYRTVNGENPNEANVRYFIQYRFLKLYRESNPTKKMAGLEGMGKVLGETSGVAAAFATKIGGWVMSFMSYFVGVGARLFYRFATALAQYGLAISLMMTPIIYMMGLIIPGWSLQIILAPIAAVLYFKSVAVSFVIIDFLILKLSGAQEIFTSGSIEKSLLVFIAAAGYMGAFGLTGFLLFGLGSAGALVQNLGGQMDGAAKQGAGSLSSMVSSPAKALGAGIVSVGGGMAGAAYKGHRGVTTNKSLKAEALKEYGGDESKANAYMKSLANRTAIKESREVWDASTDALSRIPIIGGIIKESLNAGDQSSATAKTFMAMDKVAKAEGSKAPTYQELKQSGKEAGYLRQAESELVAGGHNRAASQLAINNISNIAVDEQNRTIGKGLQAAAGGSNEPNVDSEGKDIAGLKVTIDGLKSLITSLGNAQKYAKSRGLEGTSEAKQEMAEIAINAMTNGLENGEKVVRVFQGVAKEDSKTMKVDGEGNLIRDKNNNPIPVYRAGDAIGGIQLDKDWIKSQKEKGGKDYEALKEMLMTSGGVDDTYQLSDDDHEVFVTGSYTPPNKGKGAAPIAPTTSKEPESAGATRANNGGGTGANTANAGTNQNVGNRNEQIVPQGTGGIDGKQIGKEIVDGMKGKLSGGNHKTDNSEFGGGSYKAVDDGTILIDSYESSVAAKRRKANEKKHSEALANASKKPPEDKA